jgi:ABC-type polysaccharide/polyol phosphate export permease
MAVVIDGFRWAFAQGPAPPLQEWLIGGASAAVVLALGYVYFRRREPYFADLL